MLQDTQIVKPSRKMYVDNENSENSNLKTHQNVDSAITIS